ncbi:MAG: amidohydrolase family protein, partial [Vulcanimicrobiota bacterium]
AGACGGITTFIDFAHHKPGESPLQAMKDRIEEAKDQCFIDYSFHMGMAEFTPENLAMIPQFIEMGIPSFKLYMIYAKEGWMSNDSNTYDMLQAARQYGALIMVHAENPFLIDNFTEKLQKENKVDIPWLPVSRPHFVEIEAIKRALYLTEVTESRIYIVHVSTAEGASLISEAKGRGVAAFGETCPQYLVLNESIYQKEDAWLFTCNPPLRTPIDQAVLWESISKGGLQIISTDHCSFSREQKTAGKLDFTKLPNGLPGIETLMPLTFSEGVRKGMLTLNQWVDCLCTNPAKMFGLYPGKGNLSPGSDADIVIFDPEKEVELRPGVLHYAVDYTPFEGMTVTGWPVMTISRGEVIYNNGKFSTDKGRGNFVPRYYD